MTKTLHEVLMEFTSVPTRSEKINVLRKNLNYEMAYVLKGTFHPGIKYTFDKVPEYKPMIAPEGMGYSTINSEIQRVYLFETNNPKRPNLTKKRERELLLQMLESMDAKDSKIFAGMLEKKLDVPGLDYEIVKEAFPNLLP